MSEFDDYVTTLPESHWSKYDLAAVKQGWDARQDDIDRLIEHCAIVSLECVGDLGADMANESWRSLPDHLQAAINKKEEEYDE